MFKVVEGLVPAMPPDQFFTEVTRRKRQIKARQFDGCITSNVVEKSVVNNTRPFVIPKSATEQYKHSYFVKTVNEWNHLEDDIVTSSSVEVFKNKLQAKLRD